MVLVLLNFLAGIIPITLTNMIEDDRRLIDDEGVIKPYSVLLGIVQVIILSLFYAAGGYVFSLGLFSELFWGARILLAFTIGMIFTSIWAVVWIGIFGLDYFVYHERYFDFLGVSLTALLGLIIWQIRTRFRRKESIMENKKTL